VILCECVGVNVDSALGYLGSQAPLKIKAIIARIAQIETKSYVKIFLEKFTLVSECKKH